MTPLSTPRSGRGERAHAVARVRGPRRVGRRPSVGGGWARPTPRGPESAPERVLVIVAPHDLRLLEHVRLCGVGAAGRRWHLGQAVTRLGGGRLVELALLLGQVARVGQRDVVRVHGHSNLLGRTGGTPAILPGRAGCSKASGALSGLRRCGSCRPRWRSSAWPPRRCPCRSRRRRSSTLAGVRATRSAVPSPVRSPTESTVLKTCQPRDTTTPGWHPVAVDVPRRCRGRGTACRRTCGRAGRRDRRR